VPRTTSPRPTAAAEPAIRAWVEDFALLLEREGLARTAGRIFGWLLVCHPAEQGLGELCRALGSSKGGVSTMARMLQQAGLVERVRLPGARRDAYRISPDQWVSMWRRRQAMTAAISAQLARGKALLAGQPVARRARLEGLAEEYAWAEQIFPQLLSGRERFGVGASARRAGRGRSRGGA
jgi:DNA-binding MarR family transcriptional regulator